MTLAEDIVVVDILGEVIANVATELGIEINYTYGQDIQILDELKRKNDIQGVKYPVFALYQPFYVDRGTGLYGAARIDKISIACLTTYEDDVPTRYGKTFKPILFPCYYSFLRQLVRHSNVTDKSIDVIQHKYVEVPGVKPVYGITDYVDQIIIVNFVLNLTQKKYC